MTKTLSNTQKINKIKDIFENDLKDAHLFDMWNIVKKIAQITYDISDEEAAKIESKHKKSITF